jgi:hypothetical protein
MRWGLVVIALQLVACVQADAVKCASGITCPAGNMCDEANIRCIAPEQIAECSNRPEGTSCMFSGADGSCRAGICELFTCGNGVRETGEQCDGEDHGEDDCTTFGYYIAEGIECRDDCTFDRSNCRGTCGDGLKNGSEICDGDELGDMNCLDVGFYKPGGLACLSTCQFDTSACEDTCGDHIKNGPELCDFDPPVESCVDIGFDVGKLECNPLCSYKLSSCNKLGWVKELANNTAWYSIHGSSDNNVWVGGQNGDLARFDGAIWTTTATGLSKPIDKLWVFSPNDVWAVALDEIEHFDGTSWTKNATARADVTSIWGAAPNDVWAIGSANATVQRWNGSAWVNAGDAVDGAFMIHGSSATNVWVVSAQGLAAQWNGSMWTRHDIDQTSTHSFTGLYVLSPSDVWAVGEKSGSSPVVAHWNGLSWQLDFHPGDAYLDVVATAGTDVWVADQRGTVHFDGAQWFPIAEVELSKLYFAGAGHGFGISGDRTRIVSYRGYMKSELTFDNGIAGSMLFTTPDGHTFIGESAGNVAHQDGIDWSVKQACSSGSVSSLYGGTGDNVWGICDGLFVHFDGTDWSELAAPGGATKWYTISGSSSSNIWVGGLGGAIAYYDGQNWSRRDLNSSVGATTHITASGPNDAWALTQSGLFHWTNNSWSPVQSLASGPMVSTAPNEVFISDASGKTYRGNGTTWTMYPLPDGSGTLISIDAASRDDVFALDGAARLLHFNGTYWTQVRSSFALHLSVTPRAVDILYNAVLTRYIRTRPWFCRSNEQGFCDDGIDNDCDGKLDKVDAVECP